MGSCSTRSLHLAHRAHGLCWGLVWGCVGEGVEDLMSHLCVCPFLLLPAAWASEQLGGACLLGLGIWVIVDPTGFREIVAANPLLITGAYILLAMGGLLFLLGFLGCCGAIRENKCLLLFVSTAIPHPTRGHPMVGGGAPGPTLQGRHTEV